MVKVRRVALLGFGPFFVSGSKWSNCVSAIIEIWGVGPGEFFAAGDGDLCRIITGLDLVLAQVAVCLRHSYSDGACYWGRILPTPLFLFPCFINMA